MNSLAVKTLLDKFLVERRRGRKGGAQTRPYEEELFERWEELVGAEAGRLARPLSLEDGTLTLIVTGFTAASEVSLSKEHYKESLNRFFGVTAVREVCVRVQEGTPKPLILREKSPGYGASETFDPDAVTLTADECAWAEETASRVQDEETRWSLRHLLLLHLKREKWESSRRKAERGGL